MPTLFREATNEALDAHAATFDLLADEATWADAKGEAADVAMTCARPPSCARRTTVTRRRRGCDARGAPLPSGGRGRGGGGEAVQGSVPHADGDAAGVARGDIPLKSGDCRRPPWPQTLLAIAEAGGHQILLDRHRQGSDSVVMARPFDEDTTPKAVKGSALLAAAAADDGAGWRRLWRRGASGVSS